MQAFTLYTAEVISVVLDLAIGVPLTAPLIGALMTINFARETPLTLAQAARTLPGGAVHVSTIHRWRQKGVRGVRLETFLRGGVRYTTDQAIERFFAATTAAADGHTPPDRTSRQRQQAMLRAEKELADAGL
jgi:hypothetical protein